jgi:hypothetical protein
MGGRSAAGRWISAAGRPATPMWGVALIGVQQCGKTMSATTGTFAENEAGMIMVVGATRTVGREVVRWLAPTGLRPLALQELADEDTWVRADLDRPATSCAMDRLFLLTRQTSRQLAQQEAVIAAAAPSCRGAWSKFRYSMPRRTRYRRSPASIDGPSLRCRTPDSVVRSVFFMQTLFAMVRDATIAVAGGGRIAMVDARDGRIRLRRRADGRLR